MRYGEKIWYCNRIKGNNCETDKYNSPTEFIIRPYNVFNRISMTIQAKNGYTDILQYGEKTKDMQRVILRPYQVWNNVFNIGDLFYINGASPENEQYNGENANYYVEWINKGNETIELSLKNR